MLAVSAVIGGSNAGGLVTLDGRAVGDAPAAAALGAQGNSYIGLHPDKTGFYGVTRKLGFEEGRLISCPPDVEAYDWNGLVELMLRCGELKSPRERRFPFVAARLELGGTLAVLYYEDGLWLSLERSGRVQAGYLLHAQAVTGELMLSGRQLVALAHGNGRDACLMLDEQLMHMGRLEADSIVIEDGAPVSTERLPSLCGYELRTRWSFIDGAFMPVSTERGFFTHAPMEQGPGARFLEALLYGADADAEAMLAPALGMDAGSARAFLGDYDFVRAHPLNPRALGIGMHTEGVTRMRTLVFETDGERIVNILEDP